MMFRKTKYPLIVTDNYEFGFNPNYAFAYFKYAGTGGWSLHFLYFYIFKPKYLKACS